MKLKTVGQLQGEYLKHGIGLTRKGRGRNQTFLLSRLHSNRPVLGILKLYCIHRLQLVEENVRLFNENFREANP